MIIMQSARYENNESLLSQAPCLGEHFNLSDLTTHFTFLH